MQNQWENKAYAGFFVRLAAYAVDSLIAALAVGIVKMPFSIAAMSGVSFLKADFIFDYSVLDVLGYVGVGAYFVLLTYFTHSTPGKMIFRLEVVVKDKEWTFLNILYRETVGRFLSGLLCIGYLAVLVQKDKQGFHDMLCDTYVVYKNMTVQPVMAVQSVPSGQVRMADAPIDTDSLTDSVPEQNSSVATYHSAFEMPEGHPVSIEPEKPEEPISDSYDNMNPIDELDES